MNYVCYYYGHDFRRHDLSATGYPVILGNPVCNRCNAQAGPHTYHFQGTYQNSHYDTFHMGSKDTSPDEAEE